MVGPAVLHPSEDPCGTGTGTDRDGCGEFTGGRGQGWDGGSGKRIWVRFFGPASDLSSVKWVKRRGCSIMWNVLMGSGEQDSSWVIQGSPGISGNVLGQEEGTPGPDSVSQPGGHSSDLGFCISQPFLHNPSLPWPSLFIFLGGTQVWNTCPTIPNGKPGCLTPSAPFSGAAPKRGVSSPSPWAGKGLPVPAPPHWRNRRKQGLGSRRESALGEEI